MKKYINLLYSFLWIISVSLIRAQEVPKPGLPQEIPVILRNASIHPGDGKPAYIADILIDAGKIRKIGKVTETFKRSEDIDLTGKHIYPGIIALNTHLGLSEIEAARPTNDTREAGAYNPGLRSIVAYNTDSRVIGTVRSNGILAAQIISQSGIIQGTSALVQLDAWNWEDAALKKEDALFIHWPLDKRKEEDIQKLEHWFVSARAWMNAGNKAPADLNLAALVPVLRRERKVFIRANTSREIEQAIAFCDKHSLDMVLVGGYEAWKIGEMLAQRNIPVVLTDLHRLPARDEEHPHLPYRLPTLLQDAGVKVCLSVEGFWQVRNLPFMAGTAAGFGISPEDALRMISLNPAEVLNMDSVMGSITEGKDAFLIITHGDLLDARESHIEKLMIQGRWVSIENKQTQLYEKYRADKP